MNPLLSLETVSPAEVARLPQPDSTGNLELVALDNTFPRKLVRVPASSVGGGSVPDATTSTAGKVQLAAPGNLASASPSATAVPTAAEVRAAMASRRYFDAEDYGASPAASAATNTTALNQALALAGAAGGGVVQLTTPGTYDVSATLFIYTRTHLNISPGVVLRKATGSNYDHIICNDGARTGVRDFDIRITGLRFSVNGVDVRNYSVHWGLEGQLAFFHVARLTLEHCSSDDIGTVQFATHFADWDQVLTENCTFRGGKDGIHVKGGNGLIVRNCRFRLKDDAIALNMQDRLGATPFYRDLENVLIENCVDEDLGAPMDGYFARIIPGSWAAWANGASYQQHDTTTHAGRIYKKANAGTATASVEPTHTSGAVTGADGIAWQFVQTSAITEVNAYNIVFRNIKHESRRQGISLHVDASSLIGRSQYPGTEGNAFINDLTIDGWTFRPAGTSGSFFPVVPMCRTKSLTVNNITFFAGALPWRFFQLADAGVIERAVLRNVNLPTFGGAGGLFQATATDLGKITKLVVEDSRLVGGTSGGTYTSGDGWLVSDNNNAFTEVHFSRCEIDWARSWLFATKSTLEMRMTDCRVKKHQRGAYIPSSADAATAIIVRCSGCTFDAPDLFEVVNFKSGAAMTVWFEGTTHAGTCIDSTSSGTLRAPFSDWPVRRLSLTPQTGDLARTTTDSRWAEWTGSAWVLIGN